MTDERKAELEKKIKCLKAWNDYYSDRIASLQDEMQEHKHGGFPSDPPDPQFLGMPSIEQTVPHQNFDRVMDRYTEKASAILLKILVIKDWQSEVITKMTKYNQELSFG